MTGDVENPASVRAVSVRVTAAGVTADAVDQGCRRTRDHVPSPPRV